MALVFVGTAASAEAQAHPTECAEFTSQAAAQVYFDSQGEDYLNLDADGNGVACDESGAFGQPGTGPSAHPSECEDFATQAEAQTYFDAQGEDYQNLDPDGNGIACDESSAPDQPESGTNNDGVVELPSTGSGAINQENDLAPLLATLAALLLTVATLTTRRTIA